MPRTFTPYDLTHGVTLAQYLSLSTADQLAFDRALTALWLRNTAEQYQRDCELDAQTADRGA